MVKVCDAIMGSGKSSAAITMMNENPDKKFIYITPYLDETKRIREACPSMHIVEPRKQTKYRGSKTLHTVDLVREGHNVATTHQAFKYYPPELLAMIREQGYVLIVDESLSVFDDARVSEADIQMALDAGYISIDEHGVITLVNDAYHGGVFKGLFRLLRTRDIVQIRRGGTNRYYYWTLPPSLFTSAKDMYILTYRFDGQELKWLLDIYGIQYEKIGVARDADGGYRFSKDSTWVPEYTRHLKDKIHILDDPKMNAVGDDYYSLSYTRYNSGEEDYERLKNNLYNFFRHKTQVNVSDRMWGAFGEKVMWQLRGKGYSKGFVIFNERAKNKYRNRTALAYCSNVFMNVGHKTFFHSYGFEVNEDEYALSTLIQWIWRSAIRDGNDIDLYIPSRRMRTLLTDWLDSLAKGVEL